MLSQDGVLYNVSQTVSPDDFRQQAMAAGLDRDALDANPYIQFQHWFEATIATGIPEPNAMSLATVGEDGRPSLRTVLLKVYDENGFVFFTNYGSRKARQIDAHPSVSVLFPWVALGRQVEIAGQASRISTRESLAYFVTRPRGSQIGAWASPQSQVISSRALLDEKVAELKHRFGAGQIELPSFWGGFRIVPETIEFWQARANRLHDRFRYRREGEGWAVDRLAP